MLFGLAVCIAAEARLFSRAGGKVLAASYACPTLGGN